MSRFEEFIKGMEKVHGSLRGVNLSEKDFPPLTSNLKPSSSSPAALVSQAASTIVPAPVCSVLESSASRVASSSLHGAAQPTPPSHPSWSSPFHSDQAAMLQYHQHLVTNGKPSVFIPKSIHKLGFSSWEDCLVGQFLDASPPLFQIQAIARQTWGKHDRVKILELDNGLFLLKFDNHDTRSWVLDGWPWFIAQRPLLLGKWMPRISLEKFSTSKFPIWINLRGLPMEFFTKEGINHIPSVCVSPSSWIKQLS